MRLRLHHQAPPPSPLRFPVGAGRRAAPLGHPSSQTFRVARICRDFVNLGSGVNQAVSEITESLRAASHQGHSIAAVGEPTSHGHSETRPSTDEQKVTVVESHLLSRRA